MIVVALGKKYCLGILRLKYTQLAVWIIVVIMLTTVLHCKTDANDSTKMNELHHTHIIHGLISLSPKHTEPDREGGSEM